MHNPTHTQPDWRDLVQQLDEIMPKLDYLHTFLFAKEKIEEAYELGRQAEKSEISEAVVKLNKIAALKPVDEELINIASAHVRRFEEENRMKYVRSLEEAVDTFRTRCLEMIEKEFYGANDVKTKDILDKIKNI